MEKDRRFESVYSKKVRAGKRRTYFFDVRRTRGDDFYLTLTESTKKNHGDSFERHKIFLYKEDFNRFLEGLQEVIDHVKNELLPEYDFEEFDRRQEEWETRREEEGDDYQDRPPRQQSDYPPNNRDSNRPPRQQSSFEKDKRIEDDDDGMAW